MFWEGRSFIALDIETTGLEPEKSEIIELGAVLFSDGNPIDTFSTVIKPHSDVPIFIKQLTGITDEELQSGLPLTTAFNKLISWMQRQKGDSTLVCHNSSFDIGFIQHHLSIAGLPYLTNPVADTLELSKIYLPFLTNHKLSTVFEALVGCSGVGAGRSCSQVDVGDTIICQKEYQDILDTEAEQWDKHCSLPGSTPHRALYDAFIAGKVMLLLTRFILKYIPYNLNVFISNIARHSCLSDYMNDFIDSIIKYQGLTALNDTASDLTTVASSIGYSRSYNIISNTHDEKAEDYLPPPVKDHDETDSKDDNQQSNEHQTKYSFIDAAFRIDGLINSCFESYTYRQGQVKMAKAVREAFFGNSYLLVEAGTGIGKTFAYLIAAIEFTDTLRKKVFISTNTKNLQEQIFFKDLPLLCKSISVPFKALMLKGRDNYICIRKWEDMLRVYQRLLSDKEISALLHLAVWQYYTNTGDISENSSFPKEFGHNDRGRYSSLWKKLAADRYFCSGKFCSHYQKCFYQRVRQKVEISNLIIINHHLLFADLSNNKFENEENWLIIDEAHNMPEIACQYLGICLAYYDFNNFFTNLFTVRKDLQAGFLANLKAAISKSAIEKVKQTAIIAEIESIISTLEENKAHFSGFFREIGKMVDIEDNFAERSSANALNFGKLRLKEKDHKQLIQPLDHLVSICTEMQKRLFQLSQMIIQLNKDLLADYDDHQNKLSGAVETVNDLIEALKILREPDWDNHVFWLSSVKTNDISYPNGIINYSPLDVSELLQPVLYRQIKSLIFTSATLSLRNSFKYYSSRMGIDIIENKRVNELVIPSPFDYDRQTRVLVPSYLPPHTDKYYHHQSIELLKMVLSSTKVGSMVLFTSYKDLNNVYDNLNQFLYENNKTLLAQGKGGNRTVLLNEFKQHGKAVLLGTSSFWEGIDVPGESLSLLILYKLPFQVPSEPIIEAYYENLKRDNKDPFMYATLPNAMLRFRQGFGRLIRNNTDKGIVLILDSRVVNKKYGVYFREVLPTDIKSLQSPIEVQSIVNSWFK